MKSSTKAALVRQNVLCWASAIVLPVIFHYGLAGTRFPWPIALALLLIAPMTASNALIAKAAAESPAQPNPAGDKDRPSAP